MWAEAEGRQAEWARPVLNMHACTQHDARRCVPNAHDYLQEQSLTGEKNLFPRILQSLKRTGKEGVK